MNHPILNLSLAQIRGFLREPGILFWAFGFPLAMAWVLGIAFDKTGESSSRIAWTDQRAWQAPQNAGLDVVRMTQEEAVLQWKRGKVQAIVSGDANSRVIQYDPRNQESLLARVRLERTLNPGPKPARVEIISAPGSRYVDFLVPGLLGLGIMNSCLWGTGWLMIELRIKKLLRTMIAASMSRVHYLLSFMVTRFLANAMESAVLLGFASFYFGFRNAGSWPAVLALWASGIAAFSGIGVLAGSRTSNTQVANGILNAITLPLMILSGVFFSYQNFPEWTHGILSQLPLALLSDHLRAVFLEGAGMVSVLPACAVLVGTGIVTFLAGMRIYRWY
jgi:ABC-2 type transport system permease protein